MINGMTGLGKAHEQPVALITGARWGIGLATARLLQSSGYQVYGTSRKGQTSSTLGIEMLQLEAADEDSVRRCVQEINARTQRLDVLVYSIGDGIAGAVEEISIREAIPVFEANFWGAVRLAQSVVPLMRHRRQGHVVFISSIGGEVGVPFRGFYCASKFALEAFAEALRLEVAPFGISVSLIQPPGVRTPAVENVRYACAPLAEYAECQQALTRRFNQAMRDGIQPERVARAILKVLSSRRKPLRVRVGVQARGLLGLRRVLPQIAFERLLRRVLLEDR